MNLSTGLLVSKWQGQICDEGKFTIEIYLLIGTKITNLISTIFISLFYVNNRH